MTRKFKVYNYDISLKILLFFHRYNQKNGTKLRITANALNRLDKFITIFAKTIFVNSCLISLFNNRTSVYYWTTKHITEVILRGYEINIARFKQEYDQITNPLNDTGITQLGNTNYGHRGYDYKNEFHEAFDQILREVISLYGEGQLTKGEQELAHYVVNFLLCVVDMCMLGTSMSDAASELALKVIDKSKVYIIDENVLCKVADLEMISNIDNVLGGYELLKYDNPEFEIPEFKEITIDDITEDDIEKEIGKIEEYKIKYKGYPFNLNELVVA